MKPRDLLNFFKTRTGKLVSFVAVFGSALAIVGSLRSRNSTESPVIEPLSSNATNELPQTVQTIHRPMEPFRPPVPRQEPPPAPVVPVAPARVVEPSPAMPPAPEPTPPAPLSLFADAEVGATKPKSVGTRYAPYGRLISCETVITVDSASIQTPIVGLVTEDVYHAGRLIIPAGTEVHGTAQTDRHRERIASGANWTFVWQSGEELHLKGIVLDREFSDDQNGWGITDGSAGLRGRIIKSDNLAEIKLFAATMLSGAAAALTEKEASILGSIDRRSLNNAPLKGAQDVIKVYADRILETIQRDGFYVRVPSGKQFYLYIQQTIDPSDAIRGGAGRVGDDELPPRADSESSPTGGLNVPSAQPPPELPTPKRSFTR